MDRNNMHPKNEEDSNGTYEINAEIEPEMAKERLEAYIPRGRGLPGFRARSHICDHSNNKPPYELAISRISRRGAPFWKCECLGYNVK